MEVAAQLQRARDRARLSQSDLAAAAGVSLRTVQRLESGRPCPQTRSLSRLESVLGLPPGWVETRARSRRPGDAR